MPKAHERLQALLDVRHDHQVVHDRVGRLGRDDARLGHADIAHVPLALFGMRNRGALHRALHRARTATGADVESTQAQLVTDLLGIEVLLAVDRVPAPAHDQVGVGGQQRLGVAQQAKDRIGDALAAVQVAIALLPQLD